MGDNYRFPTDDIVKAEYAGILNLSSLDEHFKEFYLQDEVKKHMIEIWSSLESMSFFSPPNHLQ